MSEDTLRREIDVLANEITELKGALEVITDVQLQHSRNIESILVYLQKYKLTNLDS